MFGSEILEVVIGLVFIYLLLSLLATTLNEMVTNFLSLRGRNLRKTLKFMFDEADCKFDIRKFYEDPLIKKFSARPWLNRFGIKSPTDFLANEHFSKILIKAVFKPGETITGIKDLEDRVDRMFPGKGDVNRILKRLVQDSGENLEQLQHNIESWYEDVMSTAAEWYKSKIRILLFVLGLLISVTFNADTFVIVKRLSTNPEIRTAIVAQAGQMNMQQIKTGPQPDSTKSFQVLYAKVDSLNKHIADISNPLGMGWSSNGGFHWTFKNIWEQIRNHIWGWLLTALAISFGAPFWFDMLRKVMNIKNVAQQRYEQAQSKT